MANEAGKIVAEIFSADEAKQDTITRRVALKTTTVQKMRKLSSLFCDALPLDSKESDMIAFFVDLSFEAFLKSGEIEKRLKALTGGE